MSTAMLTPTESPIAELTLVFLLWSQRRLSHGGRRGGRGQHGDASHGHDGETGTSESEARAWMEEGRSCRLSQSDG